MERHYQPQHYGRIGHQQTLHDREFPHRLMEGIWMWSVFSEEKQFYFNGYLIQTGQNEAFIVDPVCGGPEVLEAFAPLPRPRLIVLTNRDHERAAGEFVQYFNVPVWLPETDAQSFKVPSDHTYRDGQEFPDGWRAIGLENQKSPGETVLYHEERQILILGDALIGHPPSSLVLLPDDKYRDRAAAVQGLRPLTALQVKTALACDGDPVLLNAEDLIADALAAHPA